MQNYWNFQNCENIVILDAWIMNHDLHQFIGLIPILNAIIMLHYNFIHDFLNKFKLWRYFVNFLCDVTLIKFFFKIGYLPIVIYVPALAFNQGLFDNGQIRRHQLTNLFLVTGVNIHIITPIVCCICVFYTCVVWFEFWDLLGFLATYQYFSGRFKSRCLDRRRTNLLHVWCPFINSR